MEPAETQPPYGSWATLIWGALAVLAPPPIAALCYHYFLQGDPALSEPMLMLAKIGSVVVVASALRLKGWNIVDYLRLTVPFPREILLAIAVAIFFLVLQFVTAALTGGWFRTVVLDYVPTSFVLSILVIGPLAEEIVHRGFMYPGLARSAIEPWGAVVLLAILFAVQHEARPFSHFASGLLYGWLRWYTGSVTTPILAHAAINAGLLLISLQGYGWVGY
jgi:membrane protease YdiL (CAAX protease family)